jgi:hypothetical protein
LVDQSWCQRSGANFDKEAAKLAAEKMPARIEAPHPFGLVRLLNLSGDISRFLKPDRVRAGNRLGPFLHARIFE